MINSTRPAPSEANASGAKLGSLMPSRATANCRARLITAATAEPASNSETALRSGSRTAESWRGASIGRGPVNTGLGKVPAT
ncbi:hypothetical protein GCM10027271_29870 [Saccharopolyspora gloriosae]